VEKCGKRCYTYKYFALQQDGFCSCDNPKDWKHGDEYAKVPDNLGPGPKGCYANAKDGWTGGAWLNARYRNKYYDAKAAFQQRQAEAKARREENNVKKKFQQKLTKERDAEIAVKLPPIRLIAERKVKCQAPCQVDMFDKTNFAGNKVDTVKLTAPATEGVKKTTGFGGSSVVSFKIKGCTYVEAHDNDEEMAGRRLLSKDQPQNVVYHSSQGHLPADLKHDIKAFRLVRSGPKYCKMHDKLAVKEREAKAKVQAEIRNKYNYHYRYDGRCCCLMDWGCGSNPTCRVCQRGHRHVYPGTCGTSRQCRSRL